MSQLASIPTAAAVVGWKSMAAGFAKGVSTSFSTGKKNQLANDSVWFYQRYRGAGGITELADLKSGGGFWENIAKSKVGKHLFNWCQSMDVFATASMWAMAEDHVRSSGMNTADSGYKAAVEQCYADIIRKSQPNYTVTERSDMLRDKRGGMKLLTMYKTQSNQNLNILMTSVGEYRAALSAMRSNKTSETISDFKAAGRNLANGITSVSIGGTLAFVLLRTLVNFITGKVKPYRDKETDEITPESVMQGMLKEVGSSVFGMFSLGGQLYDLVYSVVSGDTYYGISDSAISSIAAVPESWVKLIQRLQDPDKNVEWSHIEKVLSSTLTLFGMPYKNMKGFLDMAQQWYRDLSGGTFGQYVTDATDKQYRARILNAWRDGDMEKVNDTLAILAAKSDKDKDYEVLNDVTGGFANNYLKDLVMDKSVSGEEAKAILKYIGHQNPDGVVDKWLFEMDNGYAYSGIKETYMDSEISKSEAISAMMGIGGKSREDAEEKIKYWDYESKTGVDYENRATLYKHGYITRQQLKDALVKLGGYSSGDADIYISVYDWEQEGLSNVSFTRVKNWKAYCEAFGVSKSVWLNISSAVSETKADMGSNGKPVQNSRIEKVVALIDRLSVSRAQKSAIARAIAAQEGWSDKTTQKYFTW